MATNSRQKPPKGPLQSGVLETLKQLGEDPIQSLQKDLLEPMAGDIFDQVLGPQPAKKYSGEIDPGGSVSMGEVFSGQHEEKQKLQKQISLERQLRREEEARTIKKSNELRIQLQVIMQELTVLTQTSQNLAQEIQIAAVQAPVNPGVYHVIFFEKLIEFIRSFSQKIEEAAVWLQASNKRAQKKNYWARYKQHGSKFLLSGEHYLQRSAG